MITHDRVYREPSERNHVRRAVVVALGVVASAGALASPADAKLPKTSQVETFVVKHAPSTVGAANAECSRTGPRSWSCDILTYKDIGDGSNRSYHVTARYIKGRLYAGRYVKN
jgi:hypothetical protein